jgi:sugar phosphate isomerase/epimerase
MKIGAQLYTVSKYTQNLEDLEQTLKRIADMGFKYVQLSGTCTYDPTWMKNTLDKYGLECVITHMDDLDTKVEEIIEAHNILNTKYVGLGGLNNAYNFNITIDELHDDVIKKYRDAMKKYKDGGKYFMYHNHHIEFSIMKNGKTMFENLVNEIPADEMGFTLDTYWVQYGGKNPADVIKSLPGRIPCVHFKDYKIVREKDSMTHYAPVGSGNLDWDSIIAACEEAGVEYALIEQDSCYDDDPFECLQKSYDFLISKGLKAK